MTEQQILANFEAGVRAADRRYYRRMLGIHAWAFVQVNLWIWGLVGALWVAHKALIG